MRRQKTLSSTRKKSIKNSRSVNKYIAEWYFGNSVFNLTLVVYQILYHPLFEEWIILFRPLFASIDMTFQKKNFF